jgi:FAD/FMN-containing dehydrogenase
MLPEALLQEFRNRLRGGFILPQDAAYDKARKGHNGMIDKRPACIVQCADTADVIACVNFARENKLLLSIKGGGHHVAGLGVCDDGLVIDLCRMRGVYTDQDKKTVRVDGGCLLSDIDHATHALGLAVPTGVFGTTGIGGLALGGGLGHLTRRYGLSIDNLLEVSMVLADGSYTKASAEHNPDLFWAIRGGGGNFGVVVSFLFRAHPVSVVYGGPMMWEQSDARAIMQWYREFIKEAPDEINGFFAFLTVPDNAHFPEAYRRKKMCGIVWCYTGKLEDGAAVLQPVRDLKKPAIDFCGTIPFPVLQSLFDPLLPAGLQAYWKGDYVKELSDTAIGIHLQYAAALPTPQSVMHLYPVNGAAARVGKNETAWNYRDAVWAMVISGVDPDPANKDLISGWAKDYWAALHPHSAGGAYSNFMMEEGEERIKAAFGDNYSRLGEIKAKYDPQNLFRVNQNIRPQDPARR